jgi:hypothetical protein
MQGLRRDDPSLCHFKMADIRISCFEGMSAEERAKAALVGDSDPHTLHEEQGRKGKAALHRSPGQAEALSAG